MKVQYNGSRPLLEEPFLSDMKTTKNILIQQVGRLTKNLVSKTLPFDNMEFIVKGKPDAVKRMSTWILAALEKADYKELMKPFFIPDKPGKPVYFPLIGEECWNISITD